MLKKTVGIALVCALPLTLTSVALADHEETTMNLQFSTSAKTQRAGTLRAPRPVNLSLALTQATTTGTGQPATSTQLRVALPRQMRWNGRLWPRTARCNPARANQQRSVDACPRSSRVGAGRVVALGGNGAIREEIVVTAVVTTGGDLGLFLSADAPLPLRTMLVGEVARQRNIQINIPGNIQSPVAGVTTGISELSFRLNKTTRISGRSRAIVESTDCPRGRKWTLGFTSVYTHGSLTDSDTAPCRG